MAGKSKDLSVTVIAFVSFDKRNETVMVNIADVYSEVYARN
jgi:hypothetical protein